MCKASTDEILENNMHQITEALGEYNRYFANQFYGGIATDDECMIYYINNGGAKGHRQRVEDHKEVLEKESEGMK